MKGGDVLWDELLLPVLTYMIGQKRLVYKNATRFIELRKSLECFAF